MKKIALSVWLCLGSALLLPAQTAPDSASIESYTEEAQQMVQYMAFVFNTLGDPGTSPRDKEVIVNQSYDKIFRDSEVQIEDDLIPNRSVVTNKNVQAYLKDIDFFFKEVNFEYLINEVTYDINQEGQWYFLVSAERRLTGLTVEGDSIVNSQPRFLEVNLYPEERMLKIASIYTSRVSEREDLANWWNSLGPEWKRLFAQDIQVDEGTSLADLLGEDGRLGVGDTLLRDRSKVVFVRDSNILSLVERLLPDEPIALGDSVKIPRYDTLIVKMDRILPQLRKILSLRSLDLSGHRELTDAGPLSKLRQLRELNLAYTQIRDLTPLRNLAYLEQLNITATPVYNLKPLRYNDALHTLIADASELTRLDDLQNLAQLHTLSLSRTLVGDLEPLQYCPQLEELRLDSTMILKLEGLEDLSQLRSLDVSSTNVLDLNPLRALTQLHVLRCQSTGVSDLGPLQNLQELRVINCDQTRVVSLAPLKGLPQLRRVYCDQTLVDRSEVHRFRAARPEVMVVFASAALQEWWQQLTPTWRSLLWPAGQGQDPNREELQRISEQDSLRLDGQSQIQSLDPLRVLEELTYLSLAHTSVRDLDPLSEALSLRYLDCSHTQVQDLAPLTYLRDLTYLDASHTQVRDLTPLANIGTLRTIKLNHTAAGNPASLLALTALQRLELDQTQVQPEMVRAFLQTAPNVQLIFRTQALQTWWEGLSQGWQRLLTDQIGPENAVDPDFLHQVSYLRELELTGGYELSNLEPLTVFLLLEKLSLADTRIADLGPLSQVPTLTHLSFPRHPVSNLAPLSQLPALVYLNCENNPIEELGPLATVTTLEELICTGTQVRDLDPLENLKQLRHLDCGNTEVKKLDPLEELPRLTLLECYNTRVSSRRVEKFKEARPSVEVVYY